MAKDEIQTAETRVEELEAQAEARARPEGARTTTRT